MDTTAHKWFLVIKHFLAIRVAGPTLFLPAVSMYDIPLCALCDSMLEESAGLYPGGNSHYIPLS